MKGRRKAGTKKFLYTIGAVTLAFGLGIGAILLSMLNVQASTEMMPGIEQILDEKSSETPFRILELVNSSSDAEIGYYISGQEPYLSQYTYTPENEDGTKGDSQTFSSVEEGLSVLPTKEEREEFVQGSSDMIKNPLDLGIAWDEDNPGITKKENYPLSFKSYAETYFLSKTDDAKQWNRVEFKESRKETLTGHYEENSSGKGDYTKEEQQYYPIRKDVDMDGSSTQKYRENIKNFFYSDDTEASAPYQISFESVSNTEVNDSLKGDKKTIAEAYNHNAGGFGYYENVYGELTSEIVKNIEDKKYTFPGENPVLANMDSDSDTSADDNGTSSGDTDNNSVDKTSSSADNTDDESTSEKNEMDISDTDDTIGGEDDGTAELADVTDAGTQENPYIYRGANIDEHPYYKYTLIGDLKTVKEKAKEDSKKPIHEDGDITVEDGQYWYWSAEKTDTDESEAGTNSGDATDTDTTGDASTGTDSAGQDTDSTTGSGTEAEVAVKKEALYIVTGRQAVSESQVKSIPEDFTYDYYYKVKSVDYCTKLSENGQKADPEAYTYYGWYYASHPSNEDVYIEVKEDTDITDGTTDADKLAAVLNYTATHYISEAQYTRTPGKGNYDFVEGNSAIDAEQVVEIDHLFYQGGYTNYDWFKHYVFHLDPNSKDATIQEQFKNLSIKVDTRVINENGTETDASELPSLKDYDLVYINGKLSSTQAVDIAATIKLPAIINQMKAMETAEDKKVIEDAFAAYIDTYYDTASTPYVSERIYFTDGDLCNLKFHTKFAEDELNAFSEISSYIKSENNYREVVESGGNGEKTGPLNEDISQARVIEYIINYQYKRKTAHKDTINVLDIEPASKDASLSEDTVRSWLGASGSGTVINQCCQENTGQEGENNGGVAQITDGDEDTYWHSRWSSNKESGPHWFVYEMPEEADIKGINFVARKYVSNDGNYNGRPYTLTVELLDKNDHRIKEERLTMSEDVNDLKNWDGTNKNQRKKNFESGTVSNVKYIKVTFTEAFTTSWGKQNKSTEYANCAEFSPIYADNDIANTKINITHMTSSEFVGHIDDINTEYDALYFGDSYNNWDLRRNGDLTNGKQVSLYSHSGGVYGGDKDTSQQSHLDATTRLLGLLDIDYAKGDNGNSYFARKIDDNGNYKIYQSKSAQLKGDLQLLLSPFADTETAKKIGKMRGSGNDITKQQLKELKDFVSSGYPVIIGNGLLNKDGTVNKDVVDSSSYMYEFLSDAVSKEKNRANVMSKTEANTKQNMNFFFYLAKPQIVFDSMPSEPYRLNDSKYRYNEEAGGGTLSEDDDGLSYTFEIKNDSEISTANATYNCELFIDLNFDGNLSSKEEQSEYMQIQDAEGNVVKKENGKYHLKIGKKYTLTRKIPKDYYKVITWKIQISNNDNPSIRTSRMGFTKRKAKKGEERPLKVLQIYPVVSKDNKDKKADVTWYLKHDSDFNKMLGQVDDFNITIDEKSTREYEKAIEEDENMLDNEHYQMVIIGFADGFGIDNISNEHGAVNAIRKFIEDGKSVIFAHDTTSFVNTTNVLRASNPDLNSINPSLYNPTTDSLDSMRGAWDWGYSLNTFLRASVGMDRYGITSDEKVNINGETSTVSKELKKGNDLKDEKTGESVYEKIKEKVFDMAYVFGDKDTSSLMTQGYCNNILDGQDHQNSAVTKVNEGAITQYPYHTSDAMTTSRTHSQYYQLALEEDTDGDGTNDIVVWYCLAGKTNKGANTYVNSPNDVRNNYYFYSKSNVIYTGVGDSGEADANTGKITEEEKQLFVNAIVAAANVTAVDPEATFLDDFDPVSNQEEYRYYMPDRLKASEVSDTSNILDGDNNFNIRIRDYNMVASNLSNKEDKDNSDSLTMELYIEDENGDSTITVNKDEVRVSKISVPGKVDTLKKYSDGQTIKVESSGKFELPGNDTFQFTLDNMESYLKDKDTYKKECRIFAKIKSSITLYGSPANKEAWTSISLKPRQLFDLD